MNAYIRERPIDPPQGRCRGDYCSHTNCDAGEPDGPPECALTDRMEAAGYRFQGDAWLKRIRVTLRTARKDHRSGQIKAGQKYRDIRFRVVDLDGRSRLYCDVVPA